MLRQKIKTILVSSLLMIGAGGIAQESSNMPIYELAAGVSLGDYQTGTVKYFFSDLLALEGSAGASWSGMPKMSVFVEKYHADLFMPNFHLFYGAGLGFRARRVYRYYYNGYYSSSRWDTDYSFGPSIIGGVEYDFSELINFPLAASADFRIGVHFPTPIVYPSPNLAVRYIFK